MSTEGLVSSSSTIEGEIKLRLGAKYANKFTRKNGLPQLTFELFEPDEFVSKVFTFSKGQFFDQPAAAKYLTGMINTVNKLAEEEAGSVYLDVLKTHVNFFMNCNQDRVDEALQY